MPSIGFEATEPRIRLLVLQPTPFCNIDCAYCYVSHRSDRRRMSLATIAKTAEAVLKGPYMSDQLSLVWHAGEPLDLPIDY
jgi:uncharacterized protein